MLNGMDGGDVRCIESEGECNSGLPIDWFCSIIRLLINWRRWPGAAAKEAAGRVWA